MSRRGVPMLALTFATLSPLAAQQPPTPPVASASESATPAEKPWYEKAKLSGYVFGDAYAVVDHHHATIEDQNGFWIRRAYLAFDYAIAEKWSARLRFEAGSPGGFKSHAKLDPFVKDAYLQWKGRSTDVLMGISPSPTWEYIEDFWGYRAVEKTASTFTAWQLARLRPRGQGQARQEDQPHPERRVRHVPRDGRPPGTRRRPDREADPLPVLGALRSRWATSPGSAWLLSAQSL